MSVQQLAIYHDTRSYARTQGNNNEILHATGYTVDHLAQCRSIGIVRQGYWNIVQPLTEHLGQRHYTAVSPRQVRSKLNGTIIIITVGRTDSHRLDFFDAANLLNDDLQSLYTGVHIFFCRRKTASLNSCCCLDVTAGIHYSKHGVRTS